MATYPSTSNFGSGERDSAWFIIHERSGADRLVLTTGREAALRAQRVLRGYLEAVNPNAASLLVLDGAVGPMTLGVFRDYLLAHGRNDIALAIDQELAQRPSKLDPRILRMLLGVAWNVDPALVDLPVSSGNSLPFNRRAPAPRGPGADLEVLRAYMAQSPNGGTFTISRDGRHAQTSRTPIAAAGQVRPDPVKQTVIVPPTDPYSTAVVATHPGSPVVRAEADAVITQVTLTAMQLNCVQWNLLDRSVRLARARELLTGKPTTTYAMSGTPGSTMTMRAPGLPGGFGASIPAPGGGGGRLGDLQGAITRAIIAAQRAIAVQQAMRQLVSQMRTPEDIVAAIDRHCERERTMFDVFSTWPSQTGWRPITPGGQIASVATTNNIERSIDSVAPTLPDEPGPGMGTLAIVGTVAFVGVAGGLILWLASPKPVAAAPVPARRR